MALLRRHTDAFGRSWSACPACSCVRLRATRAFLLALLVALAVMAVPAMLAVPDAYAEESSSAASSSAATSSKASSSADAAAATADGDAADTDAAAPAADAATSSSSSVQDPSKLHPIDALGNVVNPRQTPDNSFLYDTSIDELTKADASFQGNIVQVMGEVIGDSIRAEEDPGKHWITLETLEEGRASSISVLIDDEYLSIIDAYGDYHTRGTILQVRGTYYLTCPSHEGIMDIHADRVELVSSGAVIQEPLELGKFVPGLLLVAFGVAIAVLFNHLREKEL